MHNVSQSLSLALVQSLRLARYPKIERRLHDLDRSERDSMKMPVTASVLQQRALRIAEAMVKDSEDENYCARLRSFLDSTGWVINFVKQWSFGSVSLAGEGSSVNALLPSPARDTSCR